MAGQVMDWKALYLTAEGRLGQRDFWIAWLILFVAGVVSRLIPLLGVVIALALIYPYVCITAKRLHDFGRSGWLAAAPLVAGLALGIVAMLLGGAAMMAGIFGRGAAGLAMMGGMGLMVMLWSVAGLAGIVFLLWVGLTRGDGQPNAYGPPPAPVFGAGTTPTPA